MATAKKKTAAPEAVDTVPNRPAMASMTRIPGAVFQPADYASLAATLGLPPNRVAWLIDDVTNTLTAFNPKNFQA